MLRDSGPRWTPTSPNEDQVHLPGGPPITKEGSLPRLLRTYPNLYADISATSGYNALSRDKNFSFRFLNEFQDRILYGTDQSQAADRKKMNHLDLLRGFIDEGGITGEIFDKIAGKNAMRILTLARFGSETGRKRSDGKRLFLGTGGLATL